MGGLLLFRLINFRFISCSWNCFVQLIFVYLFLCLLCFGGLRACVSEMRVLVRCMC